MHGMALLSSSTDACDVTQSNHELNLLESSDEQLDSFSCAPAVAMIPPELSDVTDSVLDYSALSAASASINAARNDVSLLNLTQAASPQHAHEAGVGQLLVGPPTASLATKPTPDTVTAASAYTAMTSPARPDFTSTFDAFSSTGLTSGFMNFSNYLTGGMTSSLAVMPTAHMMTSAAPASMVASAAQMTTASSPTHPGLTNDMMTSLSGVDESQPSTPDDDDDAKSGKGESINLKKIIWGREFTHVSTQ